MRHSARARERERRALVHVEPGVGEARPVGFGGAPAAGGAQRPGGERAEAHGLQHAGRLHLAGGAGAAAGDHDTLQVERHHLQVRGEVGRGERQRRGRARRALPATRTPAAFEALGRGVAPAGLVGGLGQVLDGEAGGGGEAGDPRRVLRAGAAAALVAAAVHRAHGLDALGPVQRAHALRAADLVRGDGEACRRPARPCRSRPCPRRRRRRRAASRRRRAPGRRPRDGCSTPVSLLASISATNGRPSARPSARGARRASRGRPGRPGARGWSSTGQARGGGGGRDGHVLGRAHQQAARAGGDRAGYGEVVGLHPAGGEQQCAPDQRRPGRRRRQAGALDTVARGAAGGMHAGGVAAQAHGLAGGVHRLGPHDRGGGVVEVDGGGPAHARPPRALRRRGSVEAGPRPRRPASRRRGSARWCGPARPTARG